jgi:hypothetical protein
VFAIDRKKLTSPDQANKSRFSRLTLPLCLCHVEVVLASLFELFVTVSLSVDVKANGVSDSGFGAYSSLISISIDTFKRIVLATSVSLSDWDVLVVARSNDKKIITYVYFYVSYGLITMGCTFEDFKTVKIDLVCRQRNWNRYGLSCRSGKVCDSESFHILVAHMSL